MQRIVPLLALLIVSAGCITLPEDFESASADTSDVEPALREPERVGRITASESAEEREDICLDRGISIPDLRIQCVTRITRVVGDMQVASLPVTIVADIADVVIVPGDEGKWSAELSVSAAGATSEQARANLARVAFEWPVEDARGYALDLRQDNMGENTNARVGLLVTLPPSTLYSISAKTSSGDLSLGAFTVDGAWLSASSGDVAAERVKGPTLVARATSGDVTLASLDVERLVVETTSGDVEVDATIVDARLSSTSGDITTILRTKASGSIDIGATSGDVALGLIEDGERGYSLTASTSSGDIAIALKDGRASGGEKHQTFLTSGFDSRAARTIVSLAASSGDIDVEPQSAVTRGPL